MPILREQEGGIDISIWNRAIGSFHSPQGVMRRLNVDQQTLGEMARSGQILALPTAEGRMVYPTRQFLVGEDGKFTVNPAVNAAFGHLMEHPDEARELLFEVEENAFGVLWTIAGALLQPDAKGEILLETLQQHLENPEHESWQRLRDLNGIVSKIRALAESEEDIDKA